MSKISQLFHQLYSPVEAHQENESVVTEVTKKHEKVDGGYLLRRFSKIARMAPDIAEKARQEIESIQIISIRGMPLVPQLALPLAGRHMCRLPDHSNRTQLGRHQECKQEVAEELEAFPLIGHLLVIYESGSAIRELDRTSVHNLSAEYHRLANRCYLLHRVTLRGSLG